MRALSSCSVNSFTSCGKNCKRLSCSAISSNLTNAPSESPESNKALTINPSIESFDSPRISDEMSKIFWYMSMSLTCPSNSKRNLLTSSFNLSSLLRSIGLLSIKNFNALIPSSYKPRAIRVFEMFKTVDEYITSVESLSIFNSSSASFITWSKSFSAMNFFCKYLSTIV